METERQHKTESLVYNLTSKAKKTLLTIQEPLPLKDIAEQLNQSNSAVQKRLKRLINKKLVKKEIKSNITIYALTSIGIQVVSILLSPCELTTDKHPTSIQDVVCNHPKNPIPSLNGNTTIRGHNFRFKSQIMRTPPDFKERLAKSNWIQIDHHNWQGYVKKRYTTLLEFTPKSILYILKPMLAYSIDDIYSQAIKEVIETKEWLEETYNLVLGTPELVAEISRQHIAKPNDPFSKLAKNNKFSGKTDRVEVDASKGTPELETIHPVHAGNDMQEILDFYDGVARQGDPFKTIQKLELEVNRIMALKRIPRTLKSMVREHLNLITSREDSKVKQDFYKLLHSLGYIEQQSFFSWFKEYVGGKI